MKIVDKGWAVWGDGIFLGPVKPDKKQAITAFLENNTWFVWWHRAYRYGYRVLPTTATATVPKKKARRK